MASLPEHLQSIPAGRQMLPRGVMEEHQRTRIIEVALDVFAEKGYPATTVDDLVHAARVGVGSFYALFGGKEECLLAAYELVVEEARAETVEAIGAAPHWGAQVAIGLRALLNQIERAPARARIALIEIQSAGPPALEAYQAALGTVCGFLRRGRETGDLRRPLPEKLEETTVNGIAWLLHRRLTAREPIALDSLFQELGQLILEPYLGEERARDELAAGAGVFNA